MGPERWHDAPEKRHLCRELLLDPEHAGDGLEPSRLDGKFRDAIETLANSTERIRFRRGSDCVETDNEANCPRLCKMRSGVVYIAEKRWDLLQHISGSHSRCFPERDVLRSKRFLEDKRLVDHSPPKRVECSDGIFLIIHWNAELLEQGQTHNIY